MPITRLHCPGCTCSKTLQSEKPRAPQLFGGPDSAFSSHWPVPLGSLAASPLVVYLHTSSPNRVTCLHWHVPMARPSGHSSTCWEPRSPQLPVCPQLAPILAGCLGPCHCVCVCNQCLLHRYLQLAPCSLVYAHYFLWPPLLPALVPSCWT